MKKLLLILIILNFSCNNEKFHKEFYPNGNLKLKIALDNNGIRNGQFEEYYENGNLKGKGEFLNGVVKDSVFAYYKNGEIREKGIFHNGHKQNWWKIFGENNKILKEEEYYEVRDSAYKNQYIQYKSNGEIDYSKSNFFKFNIPDTLKIGKNLIDANEYFTDKEGDRNFHFILIIVDNKYSTDEIKKDTFRSDIKNGRVNPWFGVNGYKKGKMKIKGEIREKYLHYKLVSKDSAEAIIFDRSQYFEKEVFIIEK